MEQLITGLHHVTAFASDVKKNVEFYAGTLGLRLVKKTVNFDAPDVYHFYYGDDQGNPGTILTFFPYPGLAKGRHGSGFVNTTAFSLPYSSLDYWLHRLERYGVVFKAPQERFQEEVFIYFEDPDGLGLEFVFTEKERRKGFEHGPVPEQHAVRGLHHAEIWHDAYEKTASVLTGQMNHILVAEKGSRFRYAVKDEPGHYIDILWAADSGKGRSGSGTVHHIAFATPDVESQSKVRENIASRGLMPTEVRDRQYFRSIYFREPGGVLFEVATTDDTFTKDETIEKLGSELKLPPWFEGDRSAIEEKLQPVIFDIEKFK